MNDKKYIAFPISLITVMVLVFTFVPTAESAPGDTTEITLLLVLDELVNLNTNIIALDADIDTQNNLIATSNILSEASLQTFAIDGVSDRFFVQNMSTTTNDCTVFDKVFQIVDNITCLEPFLSLTVPQRLNYNANYTLP